MHVLPSRKHVDPLFLRHDGRHNQLMIVAPDHTTPHYKKECLTTRLGQHFLVCKTPHIPSNPDPKGVLDRSEGHLCSSTSTPMDSFTYVPGQCRHRPTSTSTPTDFCTYIPGHVDTGQREG
jgi:hypothetical protein